jgi:RNA polymerase sigma-70 factor (ECF subfamily)
LQTATIAAACRNKTFLGLILDYTQLDDVALLQRVTIRQTDALDEIYARYGRLVFSVAYHIVGDEQMAEEVTLDVFAGIWEKVETYQIDRGKVRVWLTDMTRKRAIYAAGKDNIRPSVREELWAEISASPVSPGRNPQSDGKLSSRQAFLQKAFNELAQEQRNVIALAYFHGCTQREIARLCGLPLGTVKTQIRTGIQELHRILNEEISE